MILGLDIGTNSIGWALVNKKIKSSENKIIASGVRIFPAGMDGNLQDGTQKSRNLERRQKRHLRRQNERRARRMRKIMRILQEVDLLPTNDNMALAITKIDQAALKRMQLMCDLKHLAHVVPYRLRSAALDTLLEPYELGRAIYHLAQRRGFLSNRKTASADSDEQGKVKEGINQLAEEIRDSGCRTLGEYLSTLDPEIERIRQRYTARSMFIEEFNSIVDAQKELGNKKITPSLVSELYRAIFKQRPLKSARHLVGFCTYEKDERRAPMFHPLAQKFRVLQTVNNLRLSFNNGEQRPLSAGEREKLLDHLMVISNTTVASAKKLLGLNSKKLGCKFSIEEGGEKSLYGHQVNARLIPVFGHDVWMQEMTLDEQVSVVTEINSFRCPEGLRKRGIKLWGLSDERAELLANTLLPEDYLALSVKALKKIVPLMEELALDLTTAAIKIYGDEGESNQALEFLPMIDNYVRKIKVEGPDGSSHIKRERIAGHLQDLRNPAVARSLTQVRQVVNSIIKKYGKPTQIHIELVRDLKRSVKDKKKITAKIRKQEDDRLKAAKELAKGLAEQLPEYKNFRPNRRDIEKYMLWIECRQKCPYTGKHISLINLFGSEPEFDVEHIVPYSKSLDNSFANKTLCCAKVNRVDKRNRTPFQAFSEHTDDYEKILERVAGFESSYKAEKLRRFKLENTDEFSEFSSRQLNDTSYACKLARNYLATLFGGLYDDHGLRVMAVSGGITAIVRNYFKINSILGEGDRKTRSDHRHHAVDAIVLAITNSGTVQEISDNAAEFALKSPRLMYQGDSEPWDGFLRDVKDSISAINVSHAATKKVRGALHKDTKYGLVRNKPGVVSQRIPLTKLSASDIESIPDSVVQNTVKSKLTELGIWDPEKKSVNTSKLTLLDKEENLPRMPTKNGGLGPLIKCVKIRKSLNVVAIGSKGNPQLAQTGNNHHIEIVESMDKKNQPKWEGKCVSLMEAYRRKRCGEPIIKKDHGIGCKFICSLAINDTIECDSESDGTRKLYVINAISQEPRIEFANIEDARDKKSRKQAGAQYRKFVEPLRRLNMKKVAVTPLGEIRNAND